VISIVFISAIILAETIAVLCLVRYELKG